MPKRNADYRATPEGLCIFIKSLNLMDLALNKKRKSKTISFSFVRRRKRKFPCLRTTLIPTVTTNSKKIIYITTIFLFTVISSFSQNDSIESLVKKASAMNYSMSDLADFAKQNCSLP
jgi:hypothetical protein